MTVFIDLSKNSPETIVDILINQCNRAAETGVIEENQVNVERKNRVWILTYINSFGEFTESFKTKEAALELMNELLDSGQAKEVKLREAKA